MCVPGPGGGTDEESGPGGLGEVLSRLITTSSAPFREIIAQIGERTHCRPAYKPSCRPAKPLYLVRPVNCGITVSTATATVFVVVVVCGVYVIPYHAIGRHRTAAVIRIDVPPANRQDLAATAETPDRGGAIAENFLRTQTHIPNLKCLRLPATEI